MSRFNPMAIFRRTNTPMSPDREARRRAAREMQEREREFIETMRRFQTLNTYNTLSRLVEDESSTLTQRQLNDMYEMMSRGTIVRRQRRGGHEGGYDLVHKA